MGAGEIGLGGGRCLLSEHDYLSSDPQHPCKKPDAGMCICDPGAGEVEAGRHLGLLAVCLTLFVSSRFRERPCFEK